MYNHRRCCVNVLAIMIPTLLSGCLTTSAIDTPRSDVKKPAEESIASMGDVRLGVAEIQHYLNRLPVKTKNRLLKDREALELRIRREVEKKYLVNAAMKDETMIQIGALRKKKQAEEETMRSLYLAFVTTPQSQYPDQATLKQKYMDMLERSKPSVQVHLRQIFIPFGDHREAARVKSEALLAMAKKPNANFSELARKLSMDQTTAPQGGDMGWVPVTALPPSFKKGVKGLEDGGIIGPMETDQGYHIVKKISEASAPQKSFDEVAVSLRKSLRQQRAAENLKNSLVRWNKEYPIELNLDEMPLLNREFSSQTNLN
ncbi:MAG: peptidylprolyl isomerase [Magnetococcales bacterium]|nr:peptidylprolyl isomerase [Magnetococcales bacterium]HIJ83127.1 hypothetical protein [Magnetococcales bacterium]